MLHNSRYPLLVERACLGLWQQDGFRPDGSDASHVVTELRVPYEVPVTGPGSYAVHLWLERLGTASLTGASAAAGLTVAPPTPTALYEDQPLQRRFRDSNAITAHIQVSPATWETTGRILLGRLGKRARGERAGGGFGPGQVMWNSILRNCMPRQKGPAKQPPGCERRS